jgi:hypothetical protein
MLSLYVWQSIPGILQPDKLETIQKRALKIIFTSAETYLEALQLAGIDNLADTAIGIHHHM